jgi:hypothetical protein
MNHGIDGIVENASLEAVLPFWFVLEHPGAFECMQKLVA